MLSKRGGFRRGGRGGVTPSYRIIGFGDFYLTQPSTRLMTQRVGGFLKPICILVSAEVVEELGQICKFRILLETITEDRWKPRFRFGNCAASL